jgi:hypothetical protein
MTADMSWPSSVEPDKKPVSISTCRSTRDATARTTTVCVPWLVFTRGVDRYEPRAQQRRRHA